MDYHLDQKLNEEDESKHVIEVIDRAIQSRVHVIPQDRHQDGVQADAHHDESVEVPVLNNAKKLLNEPSH